MKKVIIPLLVFTSIILLSSCASTRIVSSWREPNKTVAIEKLRKVLVVALFRTEANRRKAEDQMVGYLKGKGVVSYNYLDSTLNRRDENVIRQKIKSDGFDGAVTMRLVDVDRETLFVPRNRLVNPSDYNNFSSYYNRNYPFYMNPGHFATTRTFTVETNVFSIKEDKIIWSGVTKTTDPDGVNKMTEEITDVVYKKMIQEGFVEKH